MVKWCDKTRDKLSNTRASVLGGEIRSKGLSWLCLGLTGRGLEVWRNECVMPELHRRWGRFPWMAAHHQQLIRLPCTAPAPTTSSYQGPMVWCPTTAKATPPSRFARNKGSLPPGKRRQVIGANSICSKRSELKAAANKDKEAH